MIIALVALGLGLLFAFPLIPLNHRRSSRDIFGPKVYNCIWSFVSTVPYLLYVAADRSAFDDRVLSSLDGRTLDDAIIWYAVVQSLAFIALMAGVSSRLGPMIGGRLPVVMTKFGVQRYRSAALAAFGLACVGYVIFLSRVGGISFLLRNLASRASLSAGNSYFLSLLGLLSVGVAILIYSNRVRRTKLKSIGIGSLIALSSLTFATTGGRKSTIALFVTAAFVQHYGVRRLRRPSFVQVCLGLILCLFFVLNPILRSPGGFEEAVGNPSSLPASASENANAIVEDISYVFIYVYIVNHFDPSNIWLGESYKDVVVAPLPSGLYTNKPPVDDGVYVRSLLEGLPVEPGMPFEQLYQSSLPPETLGASYMNFWIPGVIIGMYILGVFQRLAYEYMTRSGFSLISILIYSHVVVSFEISNLRIVQAVIYVAMLFLFFRLFFGGRQSPRVVARLSESDAGSRLERSLS